ncbi:RES domain-containing protein [Serratia nematodiphila]|nr:RES domain-containing protein [Serratia nematodiphila]
MRINALSETVIKKCREIIPAGTETFRLQFGSHNGSSVYFNQNGPDCRYNLEDGNTGTMYVAIAPKTALKEVFQNKIAVTESDLDEYRMGKVEIERECHVLEVKQLITRSSVTLHDVTTSRRIVTQELARKIHAAGFDGIKFPSNVTGDDCLALWHTEPSGVGVAITREQTRLSEFELDGREAADILVDDLNISVEEG